MNKPIIAIDGTAASGKGTLARKLAEKYSFACLDTGLLYRRVGLDVLAMGSNPQDPDLAIKAARIFEQKADLSLLEDEHLRSADAGRMASVVGAVPEVRQALYRFQRQFAENPPALANGQAAKGAILDGRDIGTVICPEAVVKLYIDAAVEVRARRRFEELKRRNMPADYEGLLRDMKERDLRDSSRADAPMKPAKDAVIIDTSQMTPDEVFAAALKYFSES